MWPRGAAPAPPGPQWDSLDADGPAFTGGPEPTPRTLTEPTSSASVTVAETVTEEPIADAVPEVPGTGDPVFDGLGTAEINGADTAGAGTTDVLADPSGTGTGTGVDEGSADGRRGHDGGQAEGDRPSARRRKP